jgi:hypothetical protein
MPGNFITKFDLRCSETRPQVPVTVPLSANYDPKVQRALHRARLDGRTRFRRANRIEMFGDEILRLGVARESDS